MATRPKALDDALRQDAEMSDYNSVEANFAVSETKLTIF